MRSCEPDGLDTGRVRGLLGQRFDYGDLDKSYRRSSKGVLPSERRLGGFRGGEAWSRLIHPSQCEVDSLSIGRSVRDDWRATSMGDGPCVDELWTDKSVFYEEWAEASEPTEVNQGDRAAELPGGLVFNDIAEYSLTDDLSGEALDGPLATIAKREEATEINRHKVWAERPVADCLRDTGKPPIPVRWVSTK